MSPAFAQESTNVVSAKAPSPSGAGSAMLVSTAGMLLLTGIDAETALVAI
jgi:hypothetical protein